VIFFKSVKSELFLIKFHGLFLGLEGLTDEKFIDVV
jgi:hypothetical protein